MKNDLLEKLLALNIHLRNENGGLKVNAPKGTLTKELIAEINEHKAYLLKLLSSNIKIPKAPFAEDYSVSPTQYSLWFIHEHLGGDTAYNLTATLKIEGDLDTTILQSAFKNVIQKHESLRTQFVIKEDGNVRQRILENEAINFELESEDCSQLSKDALHQKLDEKYQTPFHLEKDLLVRANVFKLETKVHILLFVMHHIISDGWSLQIFTKEVIEEYQQLLSGKESVKKNLPLQYKDYSEWLNKELNGEAYDKKLAFWKEQFETLSPVLNLSDNPRPKVRTYAGTLLHHDFSPEFTQQLNSFTKKHQLTLFMVILGGLNGTFSKYTNQYDITLGTTVAGREHPDLEDQIGLYSNALAIRTQFEKTQSFIDFLKNQKETLLKTYEHKEYPFNKLLNQLVLPNDASRSPLFDIMVLLQNHQTMHLDTQDELHNLKISEYDEVEKGVSQLDMSFVFIERNDQLTLSVEYNTDIYKAEFIQQLLHSFEKFVAAGIANPNTPLHSISLVDATEKEMICEQFNHKNEPLQHEKTVVDFITENAVKFPEKLALVNTGTQKSYAEVDIISNQIAQYLEEVLHLKKGDFVGIAMDGNSWSILTILGVMKLGATYIPIDPNYPEARKKHIENASNCTVVIDETMLQMVQENIVNYSGEYVSKATQNGAAYIIFTSGSTGKPKGIPITHASLIDYVSTFATYFEVNESDSVLQQASIAFDTSIEEIYPILISGGTLVFHEEKADFQAMFNACEKHGITLLSTNPYALQYLNQHHQDFNLKLRVLISGGDALQVDYIDELYSKIPVYNTYGPTESTVCATYYKVVGNEPVIPIGKPIKNRQVYVLDTETTELLPVGFIGELCISGAGLTQGYLGNETLTKEKFIPHPFKEGEMLYRTGDLAKWLPDGNLVFEGRKDTQVKLRGYRIELGEIENTAQELEGITQAVASIQEVNNEAAIVLYWLHTENSPSKTQIRTILAEKLPSYMLPSYYVELEKLPINVHGKIDRKLLPDFKVAEGLIATEYIAPRNDVEEKLVNIWKQILGVEKIGVTNSFFELGGHSLLAITLINEINKEFEAISLQMKNLFASNTIESMAQLITVTGGDDVAIEGDFEEFVI
ncbi:amino acid adenylation domain-containing protein [uncultured Kordia sp.]|uniref:non-ribosomal peptide synthetase n=1 Tax=uncultured Kordia sp. TaxID=507699 RepID=UPI002606346A|nr:amino acid adenylation domain-containing protein [uncultured Kordia sp.]